MPILGAAILDFQQTEAFTASKLTAPSGAINQRNKDMIKLHPETGQAIAKLINKIDASKIMHSELIEDHGNNCYWMRNRFRAIVALTEEYGIPHVGYDIAVRELKLDRYKNAKLTIAFEDSPLYDKHSVEVGKAIRNN